MHRGDEGGVWTVLESGRSCLLVVGGIPTAAVTARVDGRLRRVQAGGADVVADLTALRSCPVDFLECLVHARERARERGHRFEVAVCDARTPLDVRRVLSLVGLVPSGDPPSA